MSRVLAVADRSILWRYLVCLALATALILAHGCHGNEDHELFTAWVWTR
jgi:hypothetical protein